VSWRDVARTDVIRASRSKSVWLLAGVLTVLFVGSAVAHGTLGEPTFVAFVGSLAGVVGLCLPLVSILLGYKSVVNERTSGSLFLSLSMPQSRRDVVVGTVLSRTVVLLVPTLLALGVAGVVGAVRYGTDGVALYPWFLFASALYGVAFLGVSVGLSLSSTADRWITIGGVGGYVLFVLFWDALHSATLLILHRFDLRVLTEMPPWALLFRLAKPTEAYYRLLRAAFDVQRAGRYVADGAPVYVDWWMALLLLLAWTLLPLSAGYRVFRKADL